MNSTIKPRTHRAFHGQIGKQGGGWAGQPSRLASQRWGDYRPDMLGFISLINSGLAAVTLCPLKKLKTALKGKLPWPSPRRKAQVKLCGRIPLYSPAHPCRRSALIKTSVNRSKKHISVCVTEGFQHGYRVFGWVPVVRSGQGLSGLRGAPAFGVCQRSQNNAGLQDQVLNREAHRPVNSMDLGQNSKIWIEKHLIYPLVGANIVFSYPTAAEYIVNYPNYKPQQMKPFPPFT